MESSVSRTGIDLAGKAAHPGLALILALISLPGSTAGWDAFPGGGIVFGVIPAIAAIVLGVQARQRSESGRGMALAAIIIGGLMVAQMVVYVTVSAFS